MGAGALPVGLVDRTGMAVFVPGQNDDPCEVTSLKLPLAFPTLGEFSVCLSQCCLSPTKLLPYR